MKTVVLGSGGWGTALSLVLHRNGHPVTLWSHVPEKAAYMERARENPRLEGVPLPPELRLTADMACLTEAELVVVAVPSYAVRETAHAAAPLLRWTRGDAALRNEAAFSAVDAMTPLSRKLPQNSTIRPTNPTETP